MKQSTSIAGLVLVLTILAGATWAEDRNVTSRIDEVVVYPDQARVTRLAEIDLPEGQHAIVLEGITPQLDVGSLRAFLDDPTAAQILGLSHRSVPHAGYSQDRLAELEQKMRQIDGGARAALDDRRAAFEEQKQLLGSISTSAGSRAGEQVGAGRMDVSQWEDAYRFIGARHIETNDSLRSIRRQLDSLDRDYRLLQAEYNQIKGSRSRSTLAVRLEIEVKRAGRIALRLEYVVGGASWRPLYDARYLSNSKQVEFTCHANVTQESGEDWNDVKFTLSTARASLGTGPSEMPVWALDIYEPPLRTPSDRRPVQPVDDMLAQVAGVVTNSDGEIFIRGGRAGEVAYIIDGVPIGDPLGGLGEAAANLQVVPPSSIRLTNFTATFEVDHRETVASGVGAVRITVAHWTLSGEESLISRPRLLPGVYRTVNITNQNAVPLLPGMVSIFADSDYLGVAPLAAVVTPGSDFELAFGKVNSVGVRRDVQPFRRAVRGERIRQSQRIDIVLTNRTDRPVSVLLEERLPASRDNRIRVKVVSISPVPDERLENGQVSWNLNLGVGQVSQVTLDFWVDYPSDLSVTGL